MKSTYTTYTGTFKKQDGQSRTMTFIRPSDIPSHLFEGKTRPQSNPKGQEVVYDVKAKSFRTFNWGTVQGSVSQHQSSLSLGGGNS